MYIHIQNNCIPTRRVKTRDRGRETEISREKDKERPSGRASETPRETAVEKLKRDGEGRERSTLPQSTQDGEPTPVVEAHLVLESQNLDLPHPSLSLSLCLSLLPP